jgi:hypothetical protein
LPVPVVPRLAKACGLVEPRGESRSSASLWWRPHKAHRPGDDGRTQAESGTTDKPASGTTVTEDLQAALGGGVLYGSERLAAGRFSAFLSAAALLSLGSCGGIGGENGGNLDGDGAFCSHGWRQG